MPDQIKAIIGLGNPGKDYESTRHNAGFMVLDLLLDRHSQSRGGVASQWSKKFQGQFCQASLGVTSSEAHQLYLLKPETYMNLSGQAVAELTRFFKIAPSEFLVIHDEVDLPFGTLRMKRGGGDGGHNGLKSIAKCLGSSDFFRLRFGVGKPDRTIAPDYSTADWVLGRFSNNEQNEIPEALKRACEFSLEFINSGLAIAQRRFH
jgi:peptidyl-tRNA hydrolase, PTH1 family